ncbi:glycosyltransferase family 2 protein [Polycladidibacter hongkongensis]|uniref:glycosyltransferase family 2 protein n=1 Tax=Polycladidibacter hongkongensis TaxID=1647556 RepID=UPI0008300092|nr:glycosyltransferase family 2 protein [Pseudovibrio hongkongensis]
MRSEFESTFTTEKVPDLQHKKLICISVMYNEELRLPDFLRHQRNLGVDHFLIIDNNSTDKTAEILDNSIDVTRFHTKESYKNNRFRWLKIVADRLAKNKWVLILDADELYVHPLWPERKLPQLCEYWDKQNKSAIFSPMIDMYSDQDLNNISYKAGDSLIACCSFFDPNGYRFQGKSNSKNQIPGFTIKGGPRERVFYNKKTNKKWVNITKNFLFKSITYRSPRLLFALQNLLIKRFVCADSPAMSKVTLLKWNSTIDAGNGLHQLKGNVKLADEWCSILHFKYLQDFSEKVNSAIARKTHNNNSEEYVRYKSIVDSGTKNPFYTKSAQKFSSSKTLLENSLMRTSPRFDKFFS